MLFNTIDFAVFFPIVLLLYWTVFRKSLQLQNLFLVIVSYGFYAFWDWRFLSLIFFSSAVDYFIGLSISKTSHNSKRKLLLIISLVSNLGLLFIFKYFNFFIETFVEVFSVFGTSFNYSSWNILLPVGISFYTFQTLSYTMDIYRKKIEPTKNPIEFFAFVSFFPQLVAGPIERASNLLPQFSRKRNFTVEQGKSGFYLIIWGLFKKVVIADNCAFFVNQIFENHAAYSSGELWIGAILFAFQIYGDFSGYSDIAIGTARLFGFDLMTNFKFPYFSKNIGDFWRRWHISLSTWFRDYVYIPLGGSKGSVWKQVRNVFIIFIVSGFWHGANWTFIVWGAFHALLFIPLLLIRRNRSDVNTTRISLLDVGRIFITFVLVTLGWIYFRADSITIAHEYIMSLLGSDLFEARLFIKTNKNLLLFAICLFSILCMLLFEIRAYLKARVEVQLNMLSGVFILLCIFLMGAFKDPSQFIYFQF